MEGPRLSILKTGPNLAPNTSAPPLKVHHPNAGVGMVEEELSRSSNDDTFISFYFPDDLWPTKKKAIALIFHRLGPLGPVGHSVAMSVFVSLCLSQKL